MKVYLITSEVASAPLAEIRTDGRKVDFIVDNTGGVLPRESGGDYERLVRMVSKSSHLKMKEPDKATSHLIRYVMDNGSVVEITTDGMTCLLDGELQDEQQKRALFAAIKSGQLKVARKSDNAVTVMASPTIEPPKVEKPKTDAGVIHLLAIMHKQDEEMEKNYNRSYDKDIEDGDREYSDDPEFSKNFAYALKHGRGEDA
jgi:hypothetical protein